MKTPHYRKIFLVHGINTNDGGEDTVVKAGRFFEGDVNTMVINCPYDRIGPLGAIFKNKKVALRLAKATLIKSPDVDVLAIGHSNGCAIIVEAARQGARIDTVVLINPALKVKTKFPLSIKRIFIIHTKHDKATRAARFFDKVPLIRIIIPNCWGAMGAVGYQGSRDDRVVNMDMSETLTGHSDFFDDKNLRNFMPMIKRKVFRGKWRLC